MIYFNKKINKKGQSHKCQDHIPYVLKENTRTQNIILISNLTISNVFI